MALNPDFDLFFALPSNLIFIPQVKLEFRIGDLGLCVNGRDSYQEHSIADTSLSAMRICADSDFQMYAGLSATYRIHEF